MSRYNNKGRENTSHKQPLVLHVYGQESPHEPARIVGNREALLTLQQLLTAVLERPYESETTAMFFGADGEGYWLTIVLNDADWQSNSWQKMELPYWYRSDAR